MSIFPLVTEHDLETVNIDNKSELPMYYEIDWDFNKDEPILKNSDFVIVEGNNAIKVWIYKAIKTVRYQYLIYSWDYGCEINSLIGQKYTIGLTKSEAERYIKECLLINPYILEVKITDVNFNRDVLNAHIKVKTIYGEVDVNV